MKRIEKILCAGNTLNDLLLRESEEYLASLGREKGGMTLVEKNEIDEALSKTDKPLEQAPGGSACNTAVGVARLRGSCSFLGKRGMDEPGNFIESRLSELGVQCRLHRSDLPTGQVLSVITPDAQRTMLTYLGASATQSPEELTSEDFADVDLLHMEGYLLFNRDLALKILDFAREADLLVSMDLSSFEVVRANRDILPGLIRDHVDILIANEDEAGEYTGKSPEESLHELAELSEIAVVKLGAAGVLVKSGSEEVKAVGQRVVAIDTTGAGDLWAGGFLYGLSRGMDLKNAAELGNRTGSAVVQVMGAHIPESMYDEIRASI